MPRTTRPRPCPRHVAAALLAGLALPAAAPAATPVATTAPGRIVVQVDGGKVRNDVDPTGGGWAVAIADRGVLALGAGAGRGALYAAKLGPSGAPDPAYGTGGVRTVVLPTAARFPVLQILRQADGKLLLIGAQLVISATAPTSAPLLLVARLNADLTLDTSYGAGGVATAPVGEGCGSCTTGALQPDGSLVLAGTTGEYGTPTANPLVMTPSHLRWSLARLTPAGAVDPSFGSGGVATIPTATSVSAFNVAIGPGGTLVTEAQSSDGVLSPTSTSQLLLARLLPSGAPDPAFAGGAAVRVPLASGFLMQVAADGSVVVNGQPARTGPVTPQSLGTLSRQYLVRYTAAGAPDPAFGAGSVVDLGTDVAPTQLFGSGPRDLVVVGTPAYALAPGMGPTPGRLVARLVAANGTIDPTQTRTVDVAFGGGYSSFLVSKRPRTLPTIRQNTFTGSAVVRRSDGSFVVPGGVSVSQPTGEGTGYSIGRLAVAGLTPAFALDPTFGGPATPLALSVRLTRQRASTAHTRHGIRIALRSSAVGLARVTISHGGRAIARSVVPIFKTARHTLPIELTTYGNVYLRHHRNVKLSVVAQGRDLLTSSARAVASGRLR